MPVKHRPAKEGDAERGPEVTLTAFREDLKMYLHPTEGILAGINTPVWTVMSDPQSPEGMRYNQIPGVSLIRDKTKYRHPT